MHSKFVTLRPIS